MQKKLNFILWGSVFFFALFFLGLSIYNPFQIREYSFTKKEEGNIEVKFYQKKSPFHSNTLSKLEKIVYDGKEERYVEKLLNVFKTAKIDTYLIHVNNFIVVGEYYQKKEQYKVALFYNNNELYQILNVKQKAVLTFDTTNTNEYDRMIIVSDTFKKAMDLSILLQEKTVEQINQTPYDGMVFLLKETKQVYAKDKSSSSKVQIENKPVTHSVLHE